MKPCAYALCKHDAGDRALCAYHRAKVKKAASETRKGRIKAGLCARCKEPPKPARPGLRTCVECGKRFAAANREWVCRGTGREKDLLRQRAAYPIGVQRRRDAVFAYYGGACACCGETTKEFLTVDHVGGGGRKHRARIKGHDMYRWLIKNRFPFGFRLLCMNCNWATKNGKPCPHRANEVPIGPNGQAHLFAVK